MKFFLSLFGGIFGLNWDIFFVIVLKNNNDLDLKGGKFFILYKILFICI